MCAVIESISKYSMVGIIKIHINKKLLKRLTKTTTTTNNNNNINNNIIFINTMTFQRHKEY